MVLVLYFLNRVVLITFYRTYFIRILTRAILACNVLSFFYISAKDFALFSLSKKYVAPYNIISAPYVVVFIAQKQSG